MLPKVYEYCMHNILPVHSTIDMKRWIYYIREIIIHEYKIMCYDEDIKIKFNNGILDISFSEYLSKEMKSKYPEHFIGN